MDEQKQALESIFESISQLLTACEVTQNKAESRAKSLIKESEKAVL